ncbi:MAG TPA: hypothetical protein VF040_04870 [Ktedonobacterales bacterium]
MRSQLFDLQLELDYAREHLQQARIALARAQWEDASPSLVEARRQAVRKYTAYVQRVQDEYAAALRQNSA